LVQEQRSEATLGDRGEVGARSLDPEHTLLATRVIDEDALGRGVSPASICHRAICAEEVRAVDEGLERAATDMPVLPSVFGSRDARQDTGDVGHAPTFSGERVERVSNRCRASGQAALSRGSKVTGAKERRTTARASSMDESSPRAITWTSRFPRSVASYGPARTGSPVASAVNWQSSELRAPPPTIWIAGGVAPVAADSERIARPCPSARLARMQRTTAPGSCGSSWPVATQNLRTRAGMSPG